MVIAVNAIHFQRNLPEARGVYATQILYQSILAHPEHEFVFLFDKPYSKDLLFAKNVKAIRVLPTTKHLLGLLYWYNVGLVLALKKIKPSILIQTNGCASLTCSIPQLLFIQNQKKTSWLQQWQYTFFSHQYMAKAAHIITDTAFTKQAIQVQYSIPENKIKVIPGAARSGFTPLSWEQKEQVKEGYTEGYEYFVCMGGIGTLKNGLNLLKAFSLFKKWHKSNMKLVMVGLKDSNDQKFTSKLASYKYKSDIVLTGNLYEEMQHKITAAAYAFLYINNFETTAVPILEAMQCGVPVITNCESSITEIGKKAVLYADSENSAQIAEYMQLLYKDETYRQAYIDRGFERAKAYDWNASAEAFWKEIIATVVVSA